MAQIKIGYPPEMQRIATELSELREKILVLPLSCFQVRDFPFLNQMAMGELFGTINDPAVLKRFQNILSSV